MELTAQILRRVYEEDLLTETEIAHKFGTSQARIGRLRKIWGIPTISRSQRSSSQIGSLDSQQREILVGSLLGGGNLSSSAEGVARYQEGRTPEMKGYLEWKVSMWGSLVSSLSEEERTFRERKYGGWLLLTKTCSQLWKWYDLFYPTPDRKKVIPPGLEKHFTPLSLAVWYWGDGGLISRFRPKLLIRGEESSLSRGLDYLKSLGLFPLLQAGKGESTKVVTFPDQHDLFFDMITPHMPPGVKNKTPSTPNRKPSQKIIPAVDIEIPSELEEVDSSCWEQLTPEKKEAFVERVFSMLRKVPFPYPRPLTREEALLEWCKLQRCKVLLEREEIRPMVRAGLSLCTSYFPNRYHARYKTSKTAYEGWSHEKELRRAIRYQLKVGHPVLPHRVLKTITMSCRTPSVFRPGVAKYVYQTYGVKGLPVWDPCAGYGGRMLGALSAGYTYIGTDVDPETVQGNLRIAEILGLSEKVRVEVSPAEKFRVGQRVGVVFTSPPYFDIERYSEREDQSWVKYPTLQGWLEGFLLPVVQEAYESLDGRGSLVLNVCDRKDVPLVRATQDIAEGVGFSFVEGLKMPIPPLRRKPEEAWEPVLVFQKR